MPKNFSTQEWRDIYALAQAALEIPEEQRSALIRSKFSDADVISEVLALITEMDQPDESTSRIGAWIGRFELIRYLGAGGAGKVYAANDPELRRTVAIKILNPDMARLQNAEGRFVREARTASALNHPNIVTIHEILRGDSTLAIVMELVEGVPLRQVCGAALPVVKVLHIGRQIAAALAAAHAAGIIHRDMKPENVMLLPDGRIKVLDFGLAKQATSGSETVTPTTEIGMPAGTLRYMSPEHYTGAPMTAKSDVFALGLVLYEMSTGRHPFERDSPLDVLHAIAVEEPASLASSNPSLPPLLQSIILAMLAKDPSSRWTAADVESALARCEAELQAPAESGLPALSVAVLPFVNLGDDENDGHFSDGLTEEIINALAQIQGLKVIARTSAFAFRGKNEDVRRIAKDLGVNYILEGSVRRAKNRIRITSQLISAADGSHMSSKRYDRNYEDVFAIQDDISADIASHLKLQLNIHKPAISTAGMQGISTGLANWHRFDTKGLNRALTSLHDLVRRFPSSSSGHAAIAMHHVGMAFEYGKNPRQELPPAVLAARRALEIDDLNAEAYAALGDTAAMLKYDWVAAERHFQRARDIKQHSRTSISLILRLLLPKVRLQEALEECQDLIHRNPVFPVGIVTKGIILFLQRDYAGAAASCEDCLELDPEFPRAILLLSYIRGFQGRGLEALQLLERLPPHHRGLASAQLSLGTAHANSGDLTNARRVLKEMTGRGDQDELFSGACACLYSLLGEKDIACEWVDKAVAALDPRLLWIRTLPWLDSLRSESRFSAILEKMGLADT
jgi:serine/threonine protein kinase/tetratricopeptide (TPR) repeat protein